MKSRYVIVEPISSGAMGAVYRARDAQAGTEVALKHLTDRRHSALSRSRNFTRVLRTGTHALFRWMSMTWPCSSSS